MIEPFKSFKDKIRANAEAEADRIIARVKPSKDKSKKLKVEDKEIKEIKKNKNEQKKAKSKDK